MITLNARLFIALLLSFILTILPLPLFLAECRPPWVLLLLLYVQFWLPNYFHVWIIFILGLCLDVMLATVLGAHAFALLLTCWFAASKTRRFHFFSTIQQMMLVVLFCLIQQTLLYLIDASMGYSNGLWGVLGSSLMGMFFWPWLRLLADTGLYAR